MEPVSGVASIFAVVSLALQLQKSAQNIKRFFDVVSDAPSEVSRLRDLVSSIHVIARNITTAFDPKQQCESNAIGEGIYDALKMCQSSMNPIECILYGVERKITSRTPISRASALFRLAWKKEQIDEFERKLDRAVSLLNISLTLGLM